MGLQRNLPKRLVTLAPSSMASAAQRGGSGFSLFLVLSWCWVPSYAVASCALSARSTTWADASDQARVFEHFNRECLNIFNFSFLLVLILHFLQYKREKLLPPGKMSQTKRGCLNISTESV